MDFVLVNPLLKAARSLNRMVALGDIAPELEELMRGGADNKVAMTERWAATAVELKSGEMVIVPAKDPVAYSEDEGWAVRVVEGGKFGGRSHFRNLDWLKQNVAELWLGVLTLPDGQGAHGKIRMDTGGTCVISVSGRAADDTTLSWLAGAAPGAERMELRALIGSLGVRSWRERLRGDGARLWMELGGAADDAEKVADAISLLGEIGIGSDPVRCSIKIADIAGALAAVAGAKMAAGELTRGRGEQLASAFADALQERTARLTPAGDDVARLSTIAAATSAMLLEGYDELNETAGAAGALGSGVAEWRSKRAEVAETWSAGVAAGLGVVDVVRQSERRAAALVAEREAAARAEEERRKRARTDARAARSATPAATPITPEVSRVTTRW